MSSIIGQTSLLPSSADFDLILTGYNSAGELAVLIDEHGNVLTKEPT